MKALLVETDDRQALFLDGRLVIQDFKLDIRDVLEAVLAKENVKTLRYFPDEYEGRIAELENAYQVSQEPNEQVRSACMEYLWHRAAFQAFMRNMGANEDKVNAAYVKFETACRAQGLPFPAPGLVERIRAEINA